MNTTYICNVEMGVVRTLVGQNGAARRVGIGRRGMALQLPFPWLWVWVTITLDLNCLNYKIMKLGLKTRFSKPILKRHRLWDSVDVTALKWQNYWLTEWQLGAGKGWGNCDAGARGRCLWWRSRSVSWLWRGLQGSARVMSDRTTHTFSRCWCPGFYVVRYQT